LQAFRDTEEKTMHARYLSLVAGCLFAAWSAAATAQQEPQTPAQRIEALIRHVESLNDAKFVRNDVAYDAKTAGQFLRGKWQAQGKDIKTAQDFIDTIASQSSTTGKPYVIRFPDGREVKSGEYLSEQLRKLEAKP
jgi:hypothetical protein